MSDALPDPLQVPALEADVVRLFAVDEAAVPKLARRGPASARQVILAGSLGVTHLLPDHAWLICLADLCEQGLEEYLVEGQGVLSSSLFADLDMIAGLTGHVLVVTSPAFGGEAATLDLQQGLTALGAWPREGAQPPGLVLPAGERAPLPGAQPAPRHYSLTSLFAVVLLLLFGAFVYVFVL